jgi:hypothetical protein
VTVRIVHAIWSLLRSLAVEGSLIARLAGYRELRPFAEREGARHSAHAGR